MEKEPEKKIKSMRVFFFVMWLTILAAVWVLLKCVAWLINLFSTPTILVLLLIAVAVFIAVRLSKISYHDWKERQNK
jgi:hypothetical protein